MTTQIPSTYDSAELLRKDKKFQLAAEAFEQLWQKAPSLMIGWRWVFCLRKLGELDKAETVIREVLKKYPTDKFTVGEFGWVLYEKEIKPGIEENDLGRVIHAANEIWEYQPTELLLAKLVLAVVKAAKKRGKWDTVMEWSGRIEPGQLEAKAPDFNGRPGMSDQELWYINRSHAMVELGRFEEARQVALEGLQSFPNELFLARNAALALAGAGQVGEAAGELRKLLTHPRADAYLKADLGELEFRQGNLDEANRLLCEAVLNPQGDQYKLGYYMTMAEIYLAKNQPVSAAESLALAKAVRQKEEWSIPAKLIQLEQKTTAMLKAQGLSWPDLPHDLKALSRYCAEHWKREASIGLKRVTGRVGRIDPEKKFVFLLRDDGERNVFANQRDLPRGCKEGTRVEFALKPSFDRKKNEETWQAADIKVIGV